MWFPEGKADPDLVLLCVHPESVEYWDTSGSKGARFLWEATKAYVRGSRPQEEQGTHGALRVH